MKRFYHETSFGWLKQFFAIALFFGVLSCFVYGLDHVSTETQVQQSESLRLAISRGIANCYAREGHYPESLEYLKEHYGIHYNEDLFFVDYQVIGENIFPDVTIIER